MPTSSRPATPPDAAASAPQPALLSEAIEAHGGLARWQSAKAVESHLHVDGLALVLKGHRNTLRDYRATVALDRQYVTIEGYIKPEWQGVLDGGDVRILNGDGNIVSERRAARGAFKGLRRQFRWDDLDMLCFAGYALWGYVNAPFMFARPDFAVSEIEPWLEDGQSWRGLEVTFPDSIAAHSKVQRYYFDDNGLLRRNDYTAEVFGGWAKATHYCWDDETFDGIVVPTRRRAMPRAGNGKPRRQVGLVNIAIESVELVN